MKINKLSAATIALSTILFACGNPSETPETVVEEVVEMEVKKSTINTEKSVINWSGEMLEVYTHSGTMAFNSGEVEIGNGNVIGGSFEANLSSMTPTDENYNEEKEQTAEKLVGHLSSPDFFDIENHPTASFVVSASEGNTVTGMLTIRGKSNEETVENVAITDTTLSGTLTFDRKKYDVAFDHPIKEMVLSNDVKLNIEIYMDL